MGAHKNKIGKSRVGIFLQGLGDVGKPLLKVAGSLTGIEALNVLSDSISTSKELSTEQKEEASALLKIDLEEVTKRWESDNKSDSWLARNIRPLTLLWLIFFMSIIIITDSNQNWSFDVKPGYIALLETLLVVVVAAYFGGRTGEKIMKK